MSKKVKLKDAMLKQAEEQQNKLDEALNNYDIEVIEAMSKELDNLKLEYEELVPVANKMTSFNKDEYFKNQARLKELPELIQQLERDKIKAYTDKEEFKSALCHSIYNNIGDAVKEEYTNNVDALLNIFDESLTELISIYKEMEKLTNSYNNTLYDVLHTKGIYLNLSHNIGLNQIKDSHNMQGDRLYLYYAE